MRIRGHICELTQNEILEYIPASIYEEIRKEDPHPQFTAYVIGHEGESSGSITIDGKKINRVKQWFSSAVKSLFESIKIGTPAYHMHAQTNETSSRMPIGKVVGKILQNIKDRLSAIVITYIKPIARNMGLDVASIEADIDLTDNGNSLVVERVSETKGIALANSSFQTPGFPGATVLAMVQEFADKNNQGGSMITIEDVKTFLQQNRIRPSELFNSIDLKKDPVIREELEDATKGEYAHRKRTDEAFERAKGDWEKEKQTLVAENKQLKGFSLKGKVKEKFEVEAKRRKLDEKAIKFLADHVDAVIVEDEATIDVNVNKFLDKGIEDFKKVQALFIPSNEKTEGSEDKPESGNGVGPNDSPLPNAGDITQSPRYKELTAP